jgi:hypothetical protein
MIVVTGYARCGKDESGTAVSGLGYEAFKTAEPLKRALWEINPPVDRIGTSYLRLQDVLEHHLDDSYKSGPYAEIIRDMYQRMGTEVPDTVLGPDVWARKVAATVNSHMSLGGKAIVTDGRRICELDILTSSGGTPIRLTRPGVKPANGHVNEIEADNYQYPVHVINNSTLARLEEMIVWITKRIEAGNFTPEPGMSFFVDIAARNVCQIPWQEANARAKAISEGKP